MKHEMTENLRLFLEVHYSSDAYKKDLEQFNPPDRYAMKTGTYEVLPGKNLLIHFYKKYRFESTVPFVTTDKLCKTEVIIITNIADCSQK